MVDSLLVPRNLTKVVEVQVKDTSEPLRLFLEQLANKVSVLEKENIALKARVTALE